MMKYQYSFLIFIASVCAVFLSDGASSVVTYTLNGGRFGDTIHVLAQAYWLSYAHGIQFRYIPFEHGEFLRVSQEHPCYNPADFSCDYYIDHLMPRHQHFYVKNDYLYVVHYHSGIKINWQDDSFKQAFKKVLMPIQELAIPAFVSNCLAVHIRTGGSFTPDDFEEKQRNPAKFPNIDYYVKAVALLLNDFPDVTDIMICTDDVDPYGIVQQIREELSKIGNQECIFHLSSDYYGDSQMNVIYDFLLLQHARFLVRPQSNFSLYAELLGDHVCVVKPLKVLAGSPFGRVCSVEYLCEGCAREVRC